MTANLDFTRAKTMIEWKEVRKSIEAVNYHLTKMDENFDQLESIFKLNVSKTIKQKAYKYLEKQDKLISIAIELKGKFQSMGPIRIVKAEPRLLKYNLSQLFIELEILDETHFRLKKSYAAFLNKYYLKQRSGQLMVA